MRYIFFPLPPAAPISRRSVSTASPTTATTSGASACISLNSPAGATSNRRCRDGADEAFGIHRRARTPSHLATSFHSHRLEEQLLALAAHLPVDSTAALTACYCGLDELLAPFVVRFHHDTSSGCSKYARFPIWKYALVVCFSVFVFFGIRFSPELGRPRTTRCQLATLSAVVVFFVVDKLPNKLPSITGVSGGIAENTGTAFAFSRRPLYRIRGDTCTSLSTPWALQTQKRTEFRSSEYPVR